MLAEIVADCGLTSIISGLRSRISSVIQFGIPNLPLLEGFEPGHGSLNYRGPHAAREVVHLKRAAWMLPHRGDLTLYIFDYIVQRIEIAAIGVKVLRIRHLRWLGWWKGSRLSRRQLSW